MIRQDDNSESARDEFDAHKLRAIVRKHLRFVSKSEAIPDDKSLYELGLDSLTTVNLLLEIENSFGCTFPDSALNEHTFESFHALRAVVASLTIEAVDRKSHP